MEPMASVTQSSPRVSPTMGVKIVQLDEEGASWGWHLVDADGATQARSTVTYPTPGTASDAAYALVTPQAFAEPDPR